MVSEALKLGTDKFLFRYASSDRDLAGFAAMQAELTGQAKDKVPELQEAGGFYTRRSLEQCSSEKVAAYKASLFNGKNILILAGGLGIDDIAFARSYNSVISLDPDLFLNRIFRYNADCLKIKNIERLDCSAETYLNARNAEFDMVYADPDRRDGGKRQILLKDHSPDLVALLPGLFAISPLVLIKCSPMYDHEMARQEISGLKHIYSISKQGEMKEMLLLASREHSPEAGFSVTCTDITNEGLNTCTFSGPVAGAAVPASAIGPFFFEAGASVVKMRKAFEYAAILGLNVLEQAPGYFSSEQRPAQFIGRSFRVIAVMPYRASACKTYLTENGIRKANVKARGMKFNSAELHRKLDLNDGGEDYIFVLPFKGSGQFIHCRY